ncbi:MAG: NAD(P)H-dependent oxidoreductase subunit E [Endomicrobium sp.]|jgi:NADH-quinone oxidoreductase subunit E|uniref:NADH-quinone oxidoreductase subunit NuoE family protein n=1 Tax=Candidatus Endomicrobiellum cubanum TaxID=3242325 RepID=UPI00281A6083|nr:NAD(P)H-dependent oxidoreductase subunit E [Endomicrobium sp.]MDR2395544.1 NAD(P)H-dependent oxidoreductase subunit E [Endomicrobium sp.]
MKSNYEKFRSVCSILEEHAFDKSKLIPILQATQEEYKYLPQEILAFISSALNISPAKVYGVATFYSHFSLTPKGKHIIRICDGTACHVKKSSTIIDALKKKLNLNGSETTTKDMLFTLETVACLGACGLAPAIVIDGKVYGQMTASKAVALIDNIC